MAGRGEYFGRALGQGQRRPILLLGINNRAYDCGPVNLERLTIIELIVYSLGSCFILWIRGHLGYRLYQLRHGEAPQLQLDAVALLHHFDGVAVLVGEHGKCNDGHAVINDLLGAEHAAVGNERFDIPVACKRSKREIEIESGAH